jgi:hypothetical protein
MIFSTDPNYGCLGFLSPDTAAFSFLCYGIFSSFFGSVGYVISLIFFSPIVCSNSLLLEPFFAQTLGCLMGIDNYPGILTVIGTVVVLVGVFELEQGNRKRTDVRRIVEKRLPFGSKLPPIPVQSHEIPFLARDRALKYKLDLENINKIIEEDIEESLYS